MTSKKSDDSKATTGGRARFLPIIEPNKTRPEHVHGESSIKAKMAPQQPGGRGTSAFDAPHTKGKNIESRLLDKTKMSHLNRSSHYCPPLVTSASSGRHLADLAEDVQEEKRVASRLRRERARRDKGSQNRAAAETSAYHSQRSSARRGANQKGTQARLVCLPGSAAGQRPRNRRMENRSNNAAWIRTGNKELSQLHEVPTGAPGYKNFSIRHLPVKGRMTLASSSSFTSRPETASIETSSQHGVGPTSKKTDLHGTASVALTATGSNVSHPTKEEAAGMAFYPCGTPMQSGHGVGSVFFRLSCFHCLGRGWMHSLHGEDYRDEEVRGLWNSLPHHSEYKTFLRHVMRKRNMVFAPKPRKDLDRHAKCFLKRKEEEKEGKGKGKGKGVELASFKDRKEQKKATERKRLTHTTSGVKLPPVATKTKKRKPTLLDFSESLKTVYDDRGRVRPGTLSPTTSTFLLYHVSKGGGEERLDRIMGFPRPVEVTDKNYVGPGGLRGAASRVFRIGSSRSVTAAKHEGTPTVISQLAKLIEVCKKVLHVQQVRPVDSGGHQASDGKPFVFDQPPPKATPEAIRARPVVRRNYPHSSKPFALVLPDGTGNLYYPNGDLAMVVVGEDVGHFTYILLGEESEVIACLCASGHGFLSWANGSPRITYGRTGGMEADREGAKRRGWAWWTLRRLTFQLRKNFALEVRSNRRLDLWFGCGPSQVILHAGPKPGYQCLLPRLGKGGGDEGGGDEDFVGVLLQLSQRIKRQLRALCRLLCVPEKRGERVKLPHITCKGQSLLQQSHQLRRCRELATRLPPIPQVVRVH